MGDLLVAWLRTFPTVTVECASLSDLRDGVALLEAFSEIDSMVSVDAIKREVGESWPLAAKNLRSCATHIESFYREELHKAADLSYVDADAIAQGKSDEGVQDMLELILGCVIECGDNQTYIGRILDMEEEQQSALQAVVQTVMGRFPAIEESPTPDAGAAAAAGSSPPPVMRSTSGASESDSERAKRYGSDDEHFGPSAEESMRQLERIEELTDHNTSLKAKNQELEQRVESLGQENERLREEGDQRRTTTDAAEWRVRELENDKQERDAEIDDLKRSAARKGEELRKMQDEVRAPLTRPHTPTRSRYARYAAADARARMCSWMCCARRRRRRTLRSARGGHSRTRCVAWSRSCRRRRTSRCRWRGWSRRGRR